VRDAWGRAVLVSAQPFTLEPLGPVEMLAVFAADPQGSVYLQAPQAPETATTEGFSPAAFGPAKSAFVTAWTARLGAGAQAKLPSPEWMERIDAWRTQIESITRVNYEGRERLSYGAYFYQAYFGIEEAWPIVALALWGRGDEAQRQAEIMLEPENLAKDNVHHQSRNGAGPAAAAAVARLTDDRRWLASVAPTLIECARWTERVREEDGAARSAVTRGLLPPHIYGGDVRDPATSLYATAACWRGMAATAEALGVLGTPALVAEARALDAAARGLHRRLSDVVHAVADHGTSPPFVPFALELPSLAGRNEGPHPQLTATRFGNYWNLFAPSFLELGFRGPDGHEWPNQWVFDYARAHGGLWALLSETFDAAGHPDGGLVLLPCVPADWLAEGQEIVLRDFPTYYGTLSARIRSSISSRREIAVEYRFAPHENGGTTTKLRFRVRLSPPGAKPQEIAFTPVRNEVARLTGSW